MLSATKVRIYPTQEQAEFWVAQFGAVRFAYNKALHLKLRKYHWLKQYDSIALQHSVINLHQAFDNFFNPKANVHREIIGVVKSITVSLSKAGKFYTSIFVDDGVETPSPIHDL